MSGTASLNKLLQTIGGRKGTPVALVGGHATGAQGEI